MTVLLHARVVLLAVLFITACAVTASASGPPNPNDAAAAPTESSTYGFFASPSPSAHLDPWSAQRLHMPVAWEWVPTYMGGPHDTWVAGQPYPYIQSELELTLHGLGVPPGLVPPGLVDEDQRPYTVVVYPNSTIAHVKKEIEMNYPEKLLAEEDWNPDKASWNFRSSAGIPFWRIRTSWRSIDALRF